MEPILTVRSMDKSFGATVALRQVDLDVYPGETASGTSWGW